MKNGALGLTKVLWGFIIIVTQGYEVTTCFVNSK